MPFIDKKQAFKILDDIKKGVCVEKCRQVWIRNIGYALKTHTNPLELSSAEHKKMTKLLEEIKGKKFSKNTTKKVDKKYLTRDSPPYPANEHCGETKKGNDGKMYVSVPDKNKICRWKLKSAIKS